MQQLIYVSDHRSCTISPRGSRRSTRHQEPARPPEPVRPDGPSRTAAAVATAPSDASGVDAGRPRWRRGETPAASPRRSRAAQTTPPHGANAARSPTTGKNLEDHPALATDTSAARRRFSAGSAGLAKIRVGPLNLLHSVQTYFCLGHCITRGLGLRRQASILRLSGAALFSRPLIPGSGPHRSPGALPRSRPVKRTIEQMELFGSTPVMRPHPCPRAQLARDYHSNTCTFCYLQS